MASNYSNGKNPIHGDGDRLIQIGNLLKNGSNDIDLARSNFSELDRIGEYFHTTGGLSESFTFKGYEISDDLEKVENRLFKIGNGFRTNGEKLNYLIDEGEREAKKLELAERDLAAARHEREVAREELQALRDEGSSGNADDYAEEIDEAIEDLSRANRHIRDAKDKILECKKKFEELKNWRNENANSFKSVINDAENDGLNNTLSDKLEDWWSKNTSSSATGEFDALTAKAVADGNVWFDEKGNLCMDGSAEAEAILLRVQGQAEFEIAGVKCNAEGMAEIGANASASASATLGLSGVVLSAAAQAKAGVSVEGKAGIKVGSGLLSAGASLVGAAFAGARADANGSLKIDKEGVAGKLGANAFAGAEASGNISGNLGPIKAGIDASAKAGIGAALGATGEITKDKIEINLDIGLAIGVGVEFKPSFSIDVKAIRNAIGNFFGISIG
jgi:hypothetical protein